MLAGEVDGYSLDKRLVRKDGGVLWGALSTHAVRTAAGGMDYLIAHLKDITRRKQAEAENIRLREMLEETQHISHVGGWEIDVASNALYWSDETYMIHETTREEYSPTVESALAFCAPEAQPVLAAAVRDAVDNGRDFKLEFDLITAKGRRARIYATSKVIREGEVTTRVIGAFQDITERKEAEETLRRSEERYRRLVEGLGNRHCVFSHTADGIFVYVSRGSESLFGIPAHDLVGRNWQIIPMIPESLEARQEADRRMIDTGTSQVVSLTCIQPDGSQRIIEMSYGPVIEGGMVVRMEGICTDMTEEVTLQSQLQQAQRMESVGRLAGASPTTSTTCSPSSSAMPRWGS